MKKTFTILAVALMALSACNKEGGRMPGMTEYIAFDSYTGGVTRTASITTENIRNFGAAAYTGSVKVMDNQLVEGGNGAWSYSPIKYWPQSGALYFSAYAPYATASNGITPTYNTSTRSFDLSYVMPADEADQVDLLMAQNVDVADCSNRPAKVQFTFGHILSRIGLTARYTGTNVAAGTTVTLTDVKVSGKFMASGDYTVSGGWANQVASASTVIYDRPAEKLAATGLTTSAQNLLAGDNYVMLIPNGSVAMDGTITVSYTVRTSDGVEMQYVKDASSPLNYEPNKTYMYNLIIDLDADAIEFGDVTVLDWGATVEQDVEVRAYNNRISVTGLSFNTNQRTSDYTITSVREYDDGEIEQIPWHAEFSLDGGYSYSESDYGFFDSPSFIPSYTGSGSFTTHTNQLYNESINVKFIQDVNNGETTIKNVTVGTGFDANGHDYVDLGLRRDGKKILFASMNIGASAPEERGNYYTWGDTQIRYTGFVTSGVAIEGGNFTWKTYIWTPGCSSSTNCRNSITKYNDDPAYGKNGFIDNLTTLELADDVANKEWGGTWRIPGPFDIAMLLGDEVVREWVDNYNNPEINGLLIHGIGEYSENYIFLPAAGYTSYSFINSFGSICKYWTNKLSNPTAAFSFYYANEGLSSTPPTPDVHSRCMGLPIRPILISEEN